MEVSLVANFQEIVAEQKTNGTFDPNTVSTVLPGTPELLCHKAQVSSWIPSQDIDVHMQRLFFFLIWVNVTRTSRHCRSLHHDSLYIPVWINKDNWPWRAGWRNFLRRRMETCDWKPMVVKRKRKKDKWRGRADRQIGTAREKASLVFSEHVQTQTY